MKFLRLFWMTHLDQKFYIYIWKFAKYRLSFVVIAVLAGGLSPVASQWRHNECDGVSNHQTHDCLLNCLFRRRSKKTSKLRVTGLCEGNSPVTGEFLAQKASNTENVSISWRHLGSITSAMTVMTKFVPDVYMWLAFEGFEIFIWLSVSRYYLIRQTNQICRANWNSDFVASESI